MVKSKLSAVPGFLAALMLLGCAKEQTAPAAEYPKSSPPGESSATDPAGSGVPTTTAADAIPIEPAPAIDPAAAEPLGDAQIIKITDTVNTGEVEQATVAKQKAKNAAVKKFAAQMIAEHKQAKQHGLKLSKQTKLDPADSATATELASKGARTLASLKAADPDSFDRLYIESQVEQHQEVLDQLDKQLIPAASDPKVTAELEKSRKMVEAHLTKAKQILEEL